MSTKSKGARKELLCAHALEKDGFVVIFKSCTVKRGPFFVGLDVADLFDVIAVKSSVTQFESKIGGFFHLMQWKFVSVKNWSDGRKHPQHQEDIKKFKASYCLEGMSFELWLWQKPRYRGRGKDKHFEQSHWEIIVV